MSDTPRTDDQIGHDGSKVSAVWIEFSCQLERDLTEARTRIKELADIGGALADNVGCGCYDGGCKTCRRAVNDWQETVKRCLEGIE